jgi:putative nucleotidyltransferase-like protein
VASNLAVDAVTIQVSSALGAVGVHSVLLKGPTIRDRLYENDARLYADTDLLILLSDFPAAEQELSGLGFERSPLNAIPHDLPTHEDRWQRGADGSIVELHRTLWGIEVEPSDAGPILFENSVAFTLRDSQLTALSPPALALHIALHSAQDGGRGNTGRDLARALEKFDPETWAESLALAKRLGAIEAFSAGLRLHPRGGQLAEAFDLPDSQTTEIAIRLSGGSRPAHTLNWIVTRRGIKDKFDVILRKAFPPREFMHAKSSIAARGPFGLVLAYLWRQVWLLANLPRAFVTWWRARRI